MYFTQKIFYLACERSNFKACTVSKMCCFLFLFEAISVDIKDCLIENVREFADCIAKSIMTGK